MVDFIDEGVRIGLEVKNKTGEWAGPRGGGQGEQAPAPSLSELTDSLSSHPESDHFLSFQPSSRISNPSCSMTQKLAVESLTSGNGWKSLPGPSPCPALTSIDSILEMGCTD